MYRKRYVSKRNYKKKSYSKTPYKRFLSRPQKNQVYKIVKKVNPPELKYTVGYFNQAITNVANINVLCNWPSQGVEGYDNEQALTPTTGAERIGNVISVKNINWRFNITVGDETNYVRVILFQFMVTTTLGAPVPGDVICDHSNSGYLQAINPLTRSKIKILMDKKYHLQKGGLETISKSINIKPRYSNIKFTTNAQAGYTADVIMGNLYYLLVSDSGAIVHPFWENTTRLCFTDA